MALSTSRLFPKDGAGSGDEQFLKSDTITNVDNSSGIITCETEQIESVSNLSGAFSRKKAAQAVIAARQILIQI